MARPTAVLALFLALLLNACGPAETNAGPAENGRISTILTDEEVVAVAYLSTPIYETKGRAHVLVIKGDGSTEAIPVGALDNGPIVWGRDVLTFSSTTTTTTARSTAVDLWKRGGTQATGHWAGITPTGQAVTVFNTGQSSKHYVTDVYTTDRDGTRAHTVIPDVPGATGLGNGALWLASAGTSNSDGTVTLYRVDLGDPSSAPSRIEWEYHDADRGQQIHMGNGPVVHRGRIWLIEELTSESQGRHVDVRLAEINPVTGGYLSHHLITNNHFLYDEADRGNPVAGAAHDGHLFRGGLYTVDAEGKILRVDLERHSMETVGDVSGAAHDSRSAAVAWHDAKMTALFTTDGQPEMTLETYDLTSGELESTTMVSVPEAIADDPDQLLYSLAVAPTD